MELTITKEKVLAAAKKCSTAKETLQVLFPEAFKNDKYEIIQPFEVSEGTFKGIFIGSGLAPEGLENRCIMIRKMDWQIYSEDDSEQDEFIIITKRKRL